MPAAAVACSLLAASCQPTPPLLVLLLAASSLVAVIAEAGGLAIVSAAQAQAAGRRGQRGDSGRPRCGAWRLDTQLVESVNSSVRIQILAAPHITLPLLSSRVTIKRHFAHQRMRGRSAEEVLSELESGHPQTCAWLRDGGEAKRFAMPEKVPGDPSPGQAAKRQRGGWNGIGVQEASAAAAATLARWSSICGDLLQPTVHYAIAFGNGAPEAADPSPSPETGLWLVCLRHYSQLWCCRASMAGESGEVCVPLDFRKLITVVDFELRRSEARGPLQDISRVPESPMAATTATDQATGRRPYRPTDRCRCRSRGSRMQMNLTWSSSVAWRAGSWQASLGAPYSADCVGRRPQSRVCCESSSGTVVSCRPCRGCGCGQPWELPLRLVARDDEWCPCVITVSSWLSGDVPGGLGLRGAGGAPDRCFQCGERGQAPVLCRRAPGSAPFSSHCSPVICSLR